MPGGFGLSDINSTLAQLMDAFLPFIKKRASDCAGFGLDRDDIVQEGLLGLFSAIRTYDPDRGAAFQTYAYTCINNGINTALTKAASARQRPLNEFVPIDDAFEAVSESSVDDLAIVREDFEALYKKIEMRLSKFEQRVLGLYWAGYSYARIAQKLSVNEKSVDNAMQRLRRKLRD